MTAALARIVHRREINDNYNETRIGAPTELEMHEITTDNVTSAAMTTIAATEETVTLSTPTITTAGPLQETSQLPTTITSSTTTTSLPSLDNAKVEDSAAVGSEIDEDPGLIEEEDVKFFDKDETIAETTTTSALLLDDESDGTTTEDNRFDISKYTNSPEFTTQSDDETPTTTEEVDMETRFDNLHLTTPRTPYFDEKHKQYTTDANDDDDEEESVTDESTQSPSTTEGSGFWGETTTEFDMAGIRDNSSESKNVSHFSDVSVITSGTYDIQSNEVNATRPRKEKKPKYLVTEEQNETVEPETELNTVSPTDGMWVLGALKSVEQSISKSGQHRNVTSGERVVNNTPDKNSTHMTKSVADWASINSYKEFTSDDIQIGDEITSTTTEDAEFSTTDSELVENNVVAVTIIPPLLSPPKNKTTEQQRPLDDVDFYETVTATTLIYDRNTLPLDELVNPLKAATITSSTPVADDDDDGDDDESIIDDKTTTQEPDGDDDDVDGDEGSFTDEPKLAITTTENNFIIKEDSSKRKTTTSATTTTETSIHFAELPSSVHPAIEDSSETIKVDTTLDSNSIENRHEMIPNNKDRENLKYSTTMDQSSTPSNSNETEEVGSAMIGKKLAAQLTTAKTIIPRQGEVPEEPLDPEASGMDAGAIIGITVSVVGVVALVLLVGFLYVMKKRQKNMTYSQRCRPVGLDAYSLDNVSVYNSVRRKANLRMSKRSYGNSAFEDPGLKNNVLNISALSSFVKDQNSIFEEFKEIPQITARVDEVPAGCENKNRYANVVPLPETRVHLERLSDDEKTEYINANFVKGPKDAASYYIACQAPLDSTIADFWRMIWEQNSKVIIMATDLAEEGVDKCAEYLPASVVIDCTTTYDDYQVTLKNREVKEKYAVSTIHLKNMQTNTWREITHFWYQWPETGVPMDEASVIAMLLEARSYLKMSAPEQTDEDNEATIKVEGASIETDKNGSIDKTKSLQRNQGPLTVHCSPGTGRTGTLIACDIALRALELPTRSVDIPQIVYYVRRGRASSVRTREQYEFIYKVTNIYATKLTGPPAEN